MSYNLPPPPNFFMLGAPDWGVKRAEYSISAIVGWLGQFNAQTVSLYIYRVSKGDNRHLLSPYIGLGMGDNRHLLSTFISNVYRLKGALYNANYALFISLVRVKTKQNIE